MQKSISIIVIAMFLFSACANQADVGFSATPVFVPSATFWPTRTPRPSATPRPTRTLTNTPRPSPTFPPVTAMAHSTLENIVGMFPELSDRYWYGSISPNGNWATISFFRKDEGDVLRLVEINGDKRWDIVYSNYSIAVCDFNCGMNLGSVGIDHWSRDNTHVYLVPYPAWDGPGLWFTTGGSTAINFNMNDGSWTDLNVGGSWAFSKDEKYLVYYSEDDVHLRTLRDGSDEVIQIPKKFQNVGRFVWSPNIDRFVFTASYGEWYDHKVGFSILLFDMKTSSLRTLIEDDMRFLYAVDWTETEKITLHQFNWLVGEEKVYFYDLTTNEIVPAPSP
jgi:hypothetical protein